ncbi:MAG: hypothetical protein D8H99_67590 [Streptococcus sp.]|nr:MAG: hypothetical protein D8H99_67590 [Streptococcus sp.]
MVQKQITKVSMKTTAVQSVVSPSFVIQNRFFLFAPNYELAFKKAKMSSAAPDFDSKKVLVVVEWRTQIII